MNSNQHSEHLQFIYDRLVAVHKENPNSDYMIKFESIIKYTKQSEDSFDEYLEYVRERRNGN
jgi:hypothetical protein